MTRHQFSKIVVLFCMIATTSGCGATPALQAAPQPPVAAPVQPQARLADARRAAQRRTALAYAAATHKMHRTYQQLSLRMTPGEQHALASEQALWLTRRDRGCLRASTSKNRCKLIMTQTRLSVLATRLQALQPPPPPTVAIAYQVPPAAPLAAVTAAPGSAPRSTTLIVAATAMPWLWKTGGLNAAFAFGYPNGTPPAALALAALGARPGAYLTIRYLSGQITLGPGSPPTDALGYSGLHDQSARGPAGKYPSAYMPPGTASLGALVGVFARADGQIMGKPFSIGDGPARVLIPLGAEQLQLGINDDIFGADNPGAGNTGALTVQVSAD